MIDVGSPLIDVAIALVFVFVLLSAICSGITEAIAAALQLRARKLEKGIRAMFDGGQSAGEGGTADGVIGHPLVNQLSPRRRQVPSYLSSRNFAIALLDTLAPRDNPDRTGSRNVIEEAKAKTAKLPEPVRRQLQPLLDEAGDDVASLRESIEDWFNASMDRVSGWYKRQSQLIVLLVAIGVTVGFNVSTIRVVDRLWNDSTVRSAVVEAAVKASNGSSAGGKGDSKGGKKGSTSKPKKADKKGSGKGKDKSGKGSSERANASSPIAVGDDAKEATKQLAALNLPIGWGEDNQNWWSWSTILGWLLTVVALWLGGPYWFQVLSKLTPLRSTGPKPKKRGRDAG